MAIRIVLVLHDETFRIKRPRQGWFQCWCPLPCWILKVVNVRFTSCHSAVQAWMARVFFSAAVYCTTHEICCKFLSIDVFFCWQISVNTDSRHLQFKEKNLIVTTGADVYSASNTSLWNSFTCSYYKKRSTSFCLWIYVLVAINQKHGCFIECF